MEKGKKAVSADKPKTARKPAAKPRAVAEPHKTAGIKKQYMKAKPLCKVTFMLPGIAAPGASSVCIVGDFNNWSITENPMKQLKNGDFSVSLTLETNKAYEFRYIIDGSRWENDWFADKYVPTQFRDTENSVVIL